MRGARQRRVVVSALLAALWALLGVAESWARPSGASLAEEYRRGLSATRTQEQTRYRLSFARAHGAAGCEVLLSEIAEDPGRPDTMLCCSIAARSAIQSDAVHLLLGTAQKMATSEVRLWLALKWATARLIASPSSLDEVKRICLTHFEPSVVLDACTSVRIDATDFLSHVEVQKRLLSRSPCVSTLRAVLRHVRFLADRDPARRLHLLELLLPLVERDFDARPLVVRVFEDYLGAQSSAKGAPSFRTLISRGQILPPRSATADAREQYGIRLHGRRIAFVLDTSESMRSAASDDEVRHLGEALGSASPSAAPDGSRFGGAEVRQTRFTLARRALLTLVSQLGSNQEYLVVAFASRALVASPWSGFGPATRPRLQAIRAWLDAGRFGAHGDLGISTNLHAGLDLALLAHPAAEAVRSGRAGRREVYCDEVVLITDGEPNQDAGGAYEGREPAYWRGAPFYGDYALAGQLFEDAERRLWASGSSLHVIGFGEARPDFCLRLAQVGQGDCVVLGWRSLDAIADVWGVQALGLGGGGK